MAYGGQTVTQRDQLMVEQEVGKIYTLFSELRLPPSSYCPLELQRESHVEYLARCLRMLPPSFASPDANCLWLYIWILHSIALLDESIEPEMEDDVIDFLSRRKDAGGGYGGGPGQGFSLRVLAENEQTNGGYRMHDGGEVDVRACYTAISRQVASILNILDDELVKDIGSYILSRQTYEGGIAAEPGSKAHCCYTFCGWATMILIDEVDRLDLPRLVDWLVFRQGVECGLQGQTNKLVDGCYSFWQGGTLTLLEWLCRSFYRELSQLKAGYGLSDSSLSDASGSSGDEGHATHDHRCSDRGLQNIMPSVNPRDTSYNFIRRRRKGGALFNSLVLQRYILLCSQDGGFSDKPGKNRDFYHMLLFKWLVCESV